MSIKNLFILFNLIVFTSAAQLHEPKLAIGLNYGFGGQTNNRNYSFSNRAIKAEVYYLINKGKKLEYQLLIEPELNYAKHQLLNLYFVTPDERNYEEKRDRFTKLKKIRSYILGIGLIVRASISAKISTYALVSIGPMVTDTETERLSKGFAFADVLGIGVTTKFKRFNLDLRPSFRHTSNAGLQKLNSGINALNFDTGISYQLSRH
ncbi:MAG: acyloxyacyl hydrolase [Bacteroidota bacterium]